MPSFILQNLDEIVSEWEAFAATLLPAAAAMDSKALRDHAKQMLQAIAKDIETAQTARQKDLKSKGLGPAFHGLETAAATHGGLRHDVGFDLGQLVAEFRAMRATVLRLWVAKEGYSDPDSVYEMSRFNEAVDQTLAESVTTYSEELAKSRETFLAILGHDLRSPLGAISNALQILASPANDVVRAKALAVGKNSVTAMGVMIRDLLDYTSTRLGKGIPVTLAQANLDSVCTIAVNEASVLYPGTEIRYEPSGKLDGMFDSARMHQVVSNLLNNAIQHGAQKTPILLVVRAAAPGFVLEVNNRGKVIDAENLQVIFEPLVQLVKEDEEPDASSNLGLGLYIAREIVVAHGGSIRAASSPDKGTTFTVEFPAGT